MSSMSFVVPLAGTKSWHSSTWTKKLSTGKPFDTCAPASVSSGVMGSGVAVATLAGALASHSSRGSQKRVICADLRAFENELGVQAPVGFWDPLGLTKDGDADVFIRRRTTEIKHGRVAMIACIGYITPEYFKWPGACSPSQKLFFSEIPNGLKALSVVPGAGWLQMILFVLAIEKGFFVQDPARAPGDFANGGVLGVPNKTSMPPGEERNKRLNAEIANGRLAMMAIIGMFYQDGLTGSAWGNWDFYVDSPLRAFENELGVQEPVGFWDPMGFAQDGDAATFRRRREVEIKHGRVSMIATIGYIVPGMGLRFGGELSPSQGINFDQVPHGLKAIGAVPDIGKLQWLLFCGLIETGLYRSDPDRAPGDFEKGGILGVPNATGPMKDAEARKRKLNAEIANGRLAMMAIIGMFFQDGLTGSAWGDWDLYTGSPLRALHGGDLHAKTSQGGRRDQKLAVGAAAASEVVATDEPTSEVVAMNDFDVTKQFGVCAPAGKPGSMIWDPAGLAKNIDASTFRQYRAAEVKHGRICMVALIGFIAQHFWHLPVYKDEPNGIGAVSTGHASGAGFAMILFVVGIIEYNNSDEGREPGDFGDPFDLIYYADFDPDKSEELTLWKNRELNHGRLAMVGFLGTVLAEYATGLDAVDQWKYSSVAFDRTLELLSFPESSVQPLSDLLP